MFSRSTRLRPLRSGASQGALDLALRDPMTNALAGARLVGLRRGLGLGQEFSIIGPDRGPAGVLWHGVNLSPISCSEPSLRDFGMHMADRARRASSVVGDQRQVELLWKQMVDTWGHDVREYRWSQPLLAAGDPMVSASSPMSGLRPARASEEDLVFPAAVAMFREEVGSDPTEPDAGRGYHSRVRSLIAAGRTYVVIRDGQVLFKADVGALFGPVAQIHGVWVHPDHRGIGIARAAMRDLVAQVRRDHAPQVSLYVNGFNTPARRAYAAAGFEQVGRLATILF